MSSDTPSKQEQLDALRRHKGHDLNVSDRSAPANVPVFSCVVYVSRHADGVQARVANLGGIESVGKSEREALSKIVAAFKQQVSELVQSGTAIPWIEPPLAAEPGEQERLIPVHL